MLGKQFRVEFFDFKLKSRNTAVISNHKVKKCADQNVYVNL